ncbi:MAG: prepilin-type N-terminal cleavage/methylation domain-containing protein [Aliivibrio sp.]|nr:prepilin-type N-terminal cleavage/methylation domain-containing protein [Aliivibrio sp.]
MKRISGFTLIELILTIIVVGIIAIAASNTLVLGFQSYNDSIDRQDNQMQAKFVIEKLSRELRHAVPNSTEVVSSQCVSFIPLEVSAFYLEFPQFNQKKIDTILLTNDTSNLDNFRLVINPSTQSDLLDETHNRFITVESMTQSGGISTFYFPNAINNPAFISSSVSERAFIYRPSVVEYCVQARGVFRNGVQIASQVTSGGFSIDNASLNRNSMIQLILTFENELGETTQYQHDVQVINVP